MFSPCSAKIRASEKDLLVMFVSMYEKWMLSEYNSEETFFFFFFARFTTSKERYSKMVGKETGKQDRTWK